MNIFQLAYEFQSIVDELEENGGELTPEIEEQLDLNQEGVKHKVEAFTQVVHQLENDIDAIKSEAKRLADLRKRKEATIETIKKLILYSIDMFGETAKSGAKFIDFGTGRVSTRRSESLEVDTDGYNQLAEVIKHTISWAGFINQPDTIDLSVDNLVDQLDPVAEATENDLQAAKASLIIPVNVSDLTTDKMSELIKSIATLANDRLKVEIDVDKQYLKNIQKSEGNCKLSQLVPKTNVIIK